MGPAYLQMCPNTADSTEVKRDWAQDVLKGMNSVTSFRVLLCFSPNVWRPPADLWAA